MPRVRTHYDNLKVARDAPPEVIRAAFQALSVRFHPKTNVDDENAAQIMAIIRRSYEILSDPGRRAEHDKWIAERESGDFVPDESLRYKEGGPRYANVVQYANVGRQSSAEKWLLIGGLVFVFCTLIVISISIGSKPQNNSTDASTPASDTSIIKPVPVAPTPEPPRVIIKSVPIAPPPKPRPQPKRFPVEYYRPRSSEIDEVIQSGKYSELPRAELVSPPTGSGPSHMKIFNHTSYGLTVTFYSETDRSIKIDAGQEFELDLEAGTYRVFCRASLPTILPFIGNQSYAAGGQYESTFYIVHQALP